MVCPHAVIRLKAYEPEYALKGAPATFKSVDAKGKEFDGHEGHPADSPRGLHRLRRLREHLPRARTRPIAGRKAINLEPQLPLREAEAANWDYFLKIPNTDAKLLNLATPRA